VTTIFLLIVEIVTDTAIEHFVFLILAADRVSGIAGRLCRFSAGDTGLKKVLGNLFALWRLAVTRRKR